MTLPTAVRRLAAAVLACTALASTATAASYPPHFRFREIRGRHATLIYHQDLEPLARTALALADEILEKHEARYGESVGRVQIVLADNEDDPNGSATAIPYPIVRLRAVAPTGADELGNYEDWMRILLTHELAHVVHLDASRGVLGAARKVLGRAPFLFPNNATPTWLIEGLATYEETAGTAFGRGRSADTRMVLRMAALQDDWPSEDRPVGGLDRWPGGLAAYLFGEAFLADLSRRHGADTLPQLSREHSSRLIPFLDDFTARAVTGSTFHALWKEWSARTRVTFEEEAARLRQRGLTPSTPLTTAAVRQVGPRFSPDGSRIAYTSRTLRERRAIRVMDASGGGDRRLTNRNGGTTLAWTPDGRFIVFDDDEVYRSFSTFTDLRVVDVGNGRRRWLTRGARAKEPDVAPDGRTVVFVRQAAGSSELWTVDLDGSGLRRLTTSDPGVQWSGPRFSPAGDTIVAARWSAGGYLDLVRVDAATGAAIALTHDRARDVEPTWTADGAHVVFRSDRDGVSNLYALDLATERLRQVTNVLGGAFLPSVSPDGMRLAFSSYGARGYDVHLMPLDLAALPEAAPFVDPYPASSPVVAPNDSPSRGHNPLTRIWPRFWTPYFERNGGETRLGAAVAGVDPLLRHAWGLAVDHGVDSGTTGAQGFYQYDRFRPTLLATWDDARDADEAITEHRREAGLTATLPFARTLTSRHALSLGIRRTREDTTKADLTQRLDLGALETAWTFSSIQQHPYSISPEDGVRLRVTWLREDPKLGSDLSLSKLTWDARGFLSLGRTVLALRGGAGMTFGEEGFTRSFEVGGFPDAGPFDVVGTNISVLRGHPDGAYRGRRFAHANAELRLPLAHPQSGWRTLPLFLRHVHAAAFVDLASAWNRTFAADAIKAGVGASLSLDLSLFHGAPLTATGGAAYGFGGRGEPRAWLRLGASF